MRNFQFLLGHHVCTQCVKIKKFGPTTGWRQSDVMSGWFGCKRRVHKSRSLGHSFWSFNKFICMKWREINRTTELLSPLGSKKKNEKKNYLTNEENMYFFVSFWFVEKNKLYVIEHIEMNKHWKFQPDVSTNGWLIRHFVLLHTGQRYHEILLIIQMHISACSTRRITQYKIQWDSWAHTVSDGRLFLVNSYEIGNWSFYLTLTCPSL